MILKVRTNGKWICFFCRDTLEAAHILVMLHAGGTLVDRWCARSIKLEGREGRIE